MQTTRFRNASTSDKVSYLTLAQDRARLTHWSRRLNYIRSEQSVELIRNSQKVACITFTNVAKGEIVERTERDPLFLVSTIHDFIWRQLKTFDNELKVAVSTLNENLPNSSLRKKDAKALSAALAICERITYSDQGSNYLEGRISHDDLLEIALIMFQSHSILARIVAARYPFILVDEYQDTSDKVISILLNHVLECDAPPVIGFFGDKWQSIYRNVVGEIPAELQKNLETNSERRELSMLYCRNFFVEPTTYRYRAKASRWQLTRFSSIFKL